MKNLANALCSDDRDNILKSLKLTGSSALPSETIITLHKTKFYDGFWIDPSFFDDKHNILSLIIANMFKDFKNNLKQKEHCDNKRELIKCFENVQMNLNVLFRKETENILDNIEALANLSTAVDLCTNIKKLIDQYLAFKGNNYNQLIIMIDDIDLNTKHAREMCEHLRKYFTHPNVIILMAVKLDQLSSAIKKDLTEEYSTLINNKDSNFSFDELDEMVERYLGKLIPHNHRLYLPEASVYFENSVRIISSEKGTSDVLGEYKSLRECVLSLI